MLPILRTWILAFVITDRVQARPASYDFPVRLTPRFLDSGDPFYTHGHLQAQGCASYTVSLDGENQPYASVSVVGQETFLFFDYTFPYNITADDDGTNDDDTYNNYDDNYNDDDGTSRRKLESNALYGSYDYYNYYGSNAILAKDWLVAFSNGALNSGCIQMDGLEVFRDAIPGMNDGRLSFETLYYGPVCSSDAANNTRSFPKLEMGVFLDSSCNTYVPGLSLVLNEVILPEWTVGESRQKDRTDPENNLDSSNSTDALELIDSYQNILGQLNVFYNKYATNCETDPQICQDITESSVDLNTCQSLASELWMAASGDYDSNVNDDASMQDSANDYGVFYSTTDGEEYAYFMFQTVLEDYSNCAAVSSDDDDCSTGWNYGWGTYNCKMKNDDGTNDYYRSNNDCQLGVCLGVLQSFKNGCSLKKWLFTNAKDLEYEMTRVYGVETRSIHFEYALVAIFAIIVVFLLAMAFWTKGILRSFSGRRPVDKKEPFLDKVADANEGEYSTGTVSSDGSVDSPSSSPKRNEKNRAAALYVW